MSALYPVPTLSAFTGDFGEEVDFLPAPDLTQMADDLIEKHARLSVLTQITIHYLWKRQGGNVKGKTRFGQCQKPSGLLAHYSKADFVIWLAADNCRQSQFTREQVEPLLLHEMLHISQTLTDDGEVRWVIVGHDIEEFAYVVQTHGLWSWDLQRFQQLALFQPAQEASV
jgi:hypothetical protein